MTGRERIAAADVATGGRRRDGERHAAADIVTDDIVTDDIVTGG